MSPSLSAVGGLLMGGPTAVVVKATLVLATAALSAVLLRRASAAFRHLIWLLGLSACAALALLSPAAPTIAVDIPTDAAIRQRPQVREYAVGEPARVHRAATTVVRVASGSSVPVAVTVESPTFGPSAGERLSSAMKASMPAIAVGVWMMGCLVILARCISGHRRIRRVINGAEPLTSPAWSSILEAASINLGFSGDVDLLASHELSTPVTSGFVRPVIILPAESASWNDERRRIVLIHELAHIARLDYVAQLVGTIACALFWFHPAVWFAAARLRAEAEHAADDRVIGAGTLGLTYATHLLDLARGDHAAALSPAVSVGMIRSSHLEGRFRAMLDSTRSRAAVTPRFQAAAATLMLCAMVPAAGLRTVAHAAPSSVGTVAPDLLVTTPATQVAVASNINRVIESNLVATMRGAFDDSTFERTIDASAGERLTLDLPTGATVVLHGWDEPRIRLVARLSGRDWRDTRVDLSQVSGGIRLRSDFATLRENQMTSHRFELWVPRHMDVKMSSAGGSVAINDLAGEFSGYTGGGGITIERVRGHASLSTGGGAVTVTNSDLSGTVSTGGGTVEISNVTGGLRGSSGSGDVIVSGDGLAATTIGGFGRGVGASSVTGTTITTNGGVAVGAGQTATVSGFGGRTITATTASGITSIVGEFESRADLEAQTRVAERQRRTSEARLLRNRLERGDFQEGDRIVVLLRANAAVQPSETLTVHAGNVLQLPRMDDLSLDGVLRSELNRRLVQHLSKYLKDPEVRTTPLPRVGVTTSVGKQGYYYTSADGKSVTTNYPGVATSIGFGDGRGIGFGGYSISKAGGQIVIDDLPNGGTLQTGGGQIIVGSSNGSVAASTGGGDIELQRVAGNARAWTGAGDVQITIVDGNGTEHSVDVFSGKGRVVLYLPATIDARFELETAYTDNFDRRTSIDSDFALDRSETAEWDDRFGTPRKYVRAQGIFGSGAGLVRVRTVNGDVIVRRR